MAGAPAQERGLIRLTPLLGAILLPLSSSFLFALSFPSSLFPTGIGALAFVCLAPFFLSLSAAPPGAAALRGLLFGAAAYALFNAWAFTFHWLAAPLIMAVHGLWMAALAPLFARMLRRRGPLSWIGVAALWTAYEWLKSSGWAGYPYGVLGYSQYLFPALSRSAGLWGVWGPSFLVCASSAWLSRFLSALRGGTKELRRQAMEGGGLLAAIVLVIVVGAALPSLWTGWKNPSQPPSPTAEAQIIKDQGGHAPSFPSSLRVLTIQPAFPARRSGALPGPYYADRLLSLVESGLSEAQGVRLIAMPETAFPPAVEIRLDYPPEDETDFAARRLLSALGETGLPAILGNGRIEFGKVPGGGMGSRLFNSALFLESGRVWAHHDKLRLVPIIEDFPSPPFPMALRKAADAAWGPLWTPGEGVTLFEVDGFRIAAPICFEDCFGSDCRRLGKGADALICLASDAWAGSDAAREQHLSCAAYRPLESGKPLLRCTNDGISALILPDGSIRRLLAPGVSGSAVASLPRGQGLVTPYQRFGDWFPFLMLIPSILALLPPPRLRRPSPGRKLGKTSFIDKTGPV